MMVTPLNPATISSLISRASFSNSNAPAIANFVVSGNVTTVFRSPKPGEFNGPRSTESLHNRFTGWSDVTNPPEFLAALKNTHLRLTSGIPTARFSTGWDSEVLRRGKPSEFSQNLSR